jgi:hypothetical protein
MNHRFENPTVESWLTAMIYRSGFYSSASSAVSNPKQPGMRDVPNTTEQLEVSRGN